MCKWPLFWLAVFIQEGVQAKVLIITWIGATLVVDSELKRENTFTSWFPDMDWGVNAAFYEHQQCSHTTLNWFIYKKWDQFSAI